VVTQNPSQKTSSLSRLKEYIESVEFDFSGSGGMAIPSEIKKELKDLSELLEEKKK
jgi:hypothetical protein